MNRLSAAPCDSNDGGHVAGIFPHCIDLGVDDKQNNEAIIVNEGLCINYPVNYLHRPKSFKHHHI